MGAGAPLWPGALPVVGVAHRSRTSTSDVNRGNPTHLGATVVAEDRLYALGQALVVDRPISEAVRTHHGCRIR